MRIRTQVLRLRSGQAVIGKQNALPRYAQDDEFFAHRFRDFWQAIRPTECDGYQKVRDCAARLLR